MINALLLLRVNFVQYLQIRPVVSWFLILYVFMLTFKAELLIKVGPHIGTFKSHLKEWIY